MKNVTIFIVLLFLVLGSCLPAGKAGFLVSFVHADELSDLEKQLSDLKHALQLSMAATTPLEQNLSKLEKSLDEIRGKIRTIEKDVSLKELQVREGETLLVAASELLGQKVK